LPTINPDTINPVRIPETQSLRQNDSRDGNKPGTSDQQFFNANYENPNKAILPSYQQSNNNLGKSLTKIKRPDHFKSYQPPDPKVSDLESKVRDMERVIGYLTDQVERLEGRAEEQNSKQIKTNYYETEMRTK
jgi:hypothetical protein